MAIVISSEPAEEPISIEEAKQHLRVDHEDDDALILNLIKVAREYAESVTHRALITQTWVYYLDEFPDGEYIELPFPPLSSVTSVIYTDYLGTATTLVKNTDYVEDVKKEPGRVVLDYGMTWPTATLDVTNAVAITYVCGYGTPEDIPQSIKNAMLIYLSDLYENRESYIPGVINHIKIVDNILESYRVNMIA